MYTQFKNLHKTQILTKTKTTKIKRSTVLTLTSIMFIILLFSSPLISTFNISPFATATTTADVTVTNKTELSAAINAAPDSTLTTIAIDRDITLTGSTLDIPEGKHIKLTSGDNVECWKLFGANNQATITVYGILELDGINVTHNGNGRGIVVDPTGNFTMISGTISGNTNTQVSIYAYGGGVYNTGVFNMQGGTISNNTVTNHGGGGVFNIGSFEMSGGIISNNTANNNSYGGGGVYNDRSSFEMSGGMISNNTSNNNGGGVCNNGGSFELSGGMISNNTAKKYGGGVYTGASNGVFVMSGDGCTIAHNTASTSGGGVYNHYGVFVMSGDGCTISNNTSTTSGGGVFNNVGSFEMLSGMISNNTAMTSGGGVCNAGSFEMLSGIISNNTATNNGGGVFNSGSSSVFVMSGDDCIITNNIANNNGGGVYNAGSFEMLSGIISNNTANTSGGGVFNNGSFEMSGGIISNNTATNGGGVYVSGGSFTLSGGVISGNVAEVNGGGIWVTNTNTYLTRLSVADGVVFSNNRASAAYNRRPNDDATYEKQIGSNVVWTSPFSQGYNNYDISYTAGTPIASYTVVVQDSYALVSGAGAYLSGSQVTVDAGIREGYIFVGWIINEGDITLSNSVQATFAMPSENVVITVQWAQIYSIYYNLNGGINEEDNPTTYTTLNLPLNIANPAKTDYTFAGWAIQYENGASETISPVNPYIIPEDTTGDITLTALWVASDVEETITYTVTYQSDDYTNGEVPVDLNSPYVSGSVVIVLDQGTLTKEGHTFLGWTTNPNTDNPTITHIPETTFTILSDTVLYAVWEEDAQQQYTITYQPGIYGTFEEQVTSNLNYGDPTPNAPTVTGVVGWEFVGWSPTPTETVEGDAIYVAQWEREVFTVIFKDWDGTVLKTQEVAYGGAATPPANPSRSGYTFTGWSPNTFTNIVSDLTVTAQYTQIYNIYYNLNGGINAENNPTTYTTLDLSSDIINPTRAGYTFLGWTIEYSDGFTPVIEPVKLYSIPSDTTGTITLTAHWNPDVTYGIEYQLNGGNYPNAPTLYAADDLPLNIANPTKGGYTFLGWTVRYENGTSITVPPVNPYTIPEGTTGDIVLTALWVASDVEDTIKYTIVYHGNGHTDGAAPLDANSPYVSGSTVIVRGQGTLVKEGYKFIGWTTNPNANTITHIPGTTFTILKNIELYAVWEEIPKQQYTITYRPGEHGTFVEKVVLGLLLGEPTPQPPQVTGVVGWKFAGWSPVPTETVEGDVVYVAQWERVMFTVIFKDWDGTVIGTQEVAYGGSATAPANPSRSGYTFTGWSPSTFSNIVSDLTVTAQYTQTGGGSSSGSGSTRHPTVTKPPAAATPPSPPATTTPPVTITPPPEEVVAVWTSVNLVLSITGVVLAILLAVGVLLWQRQNKGVGGDEEAVRRQRRVQMFGLVAVVALSVAGIVVFLLTEGLSNQMVLFDRWTVVNVVLFIAELVAIVFTFKSKNVSANSKQENLSP